MGVWLYGMMGLGLGLLVTVVSVLRNANQKSQNNYNHKSRYASSPDDQCSICMSSMCNNDMGYLPCGHGFHQKCIQELLSYNYNNCPSCRTAF